MHVLLEKFPPKVLIADNGTQAHNLYVNHKPSVVITDINMQGMNGFELTQ